MARMDDKHQTSGAPRHQPGAIGFGDRAAPASSITILLVQKLLVTREEVELLSDCLLGTLVEGDQGSIFRPSAEAISSHDPWVGCLLAEELRGSERRVYLTRLPPQQLRHGKTLQVGVACLRPTRYQVPYTRLCLRANCMVQGLPVDLNLVFCTSWGALCFVVLLRQRFPFGVRPPLSKRRLHGSCRLKSAERGLPVIG